jgi:hypothetical protein
MLGGPHEFYSSKIWDLRAGPAFCKSLPTDSSLERFPITSRKEEVIFFF